MNLETHQKNLETQQPWVIGFLTRQINTKRGRLNITVTSFLGADRIGILVIIRSDSFKMHNQKK